MMLTKVMRRGRKEMTSFRKVTVAQGSLAIISQLSVSDNYFVQESMLKPSNAIQRPSKEILMILKVTVIEQPAISSCLSSILQ